MFPAKSFAQTGNRWLLVFNTSAAMRDRAQGIQSVARDLLTSSMHGTMRPGNTIGIWTYDSQLRADEAPLLNWYPDAAQGIRRSGVSQPPPLQKTAVFGDVLTNMLRVIKMSDCITVILISDGTDPIKGTPFDARIANYYKTNYEPQKKARMPVVTVLRGPERCDHHQHTRARAVARGYPSDSAARDRESDCAKTGARRACRARQAGAVAGDHRQKSRDDDECADGFAGSFGRTSFATSPCTAANRTRSRRDKDGNSGACTGTESGRETSSGSRGCRRTNASSNCPGRTSKTGSASRNTGEDHH